MANKQNVLNTPPRVSGSAYHIGLGSVSDAKELLLRELEGFVVPFDSAHLDALLNKAASARSCSKYLSLRSNKVYGVEGWKDIPEFPDAEKELYVPLVEVANHIIRHFRLDKARQAFDTHDKNMHSDHIEGLKARPDIIITGSGQRFRGELSRCDRWYQCLSTIEVKKELSKTNIKQNKAEADGEKEMQEQCEKRGLAQIAYYARQTLSSQPTRFFVYNILITERRVRLYRFDRVGVQYSNWINYRDEPVKLVQIILLVTSRKSKEIGLDDTVTFTDDKIHFTLQKDGQPFVVTANQTPRFATLGLRGRATVCWSVRDNAGNSYLLKQQFVNTCRELEHRLLEVLQRTKADLSAVGLCILGQEFGKVSESRGMTLPVPKEFHDRRLYRLLLTEHGDAIDNLTDKTPLDLLVAIRDAIIGHKALWDAGILHRDISTNNILYRKRDDAESTLRGVLIDLDLAIQIQREESNAKADFRTGTRAFQSISVLRSYKVTNKTTNDKHAVILHEHLDDLESFFWVLLWITREQVAPGSGAELVDELKVQRHMESSVETCVTFKRTVLLEYYTLALQPGWGDHETQLVQKLAKFLHDRIDGKFRSVWETKAAMGAKELVEVAPQDYDVVLGYFEVAIAAIKDDLTRASSAPFYTDNKMEGNRNRVNSLPNPSALLPAPNIGLPIRTSSKRSREAELAVKADDPQIPQPPPEKRVRTAKSEPALQPGRRITRAASLKMLQGAKKTTTEEVGLQGVDSDGHSVATKGSRRTTRGRSSASQPKNKASTSRAGRQTSVKRSTSKAGKKT